MFFDFSLYTISLLAILVVYFRMELRKLSEWKTTREWQDVLLPILPVLPHISKVRYQTINCRLIGGAYQRFKCFKRCRGSVASQTRYIEHHISINSLYGTKDFT